MTTKKFIVSERVNNEWRTLGGFDDRKTALNGIATYLNNHEDADPQNFKVEEVEVTNDENEIKSAVNGLLQYINLFGYEFDVKYYADFSCADLFFKNTNFPLWTGAVLAKIAEYMTKPVNNGFGWTIDHKGILCIHNRKRVTTILSGAK